MANNTSSGLSIENFAEKVRRFINSKKFEESSVISINSEVIEQYIGYAVKEELNDCLEDSKELVLDFSSVRNINNIGLIHLFNAVASGERQGATVRLHGVCDAVLEILKKVHLAETFMYTDEGYSLQEA